MNHFYIAVPKERVVGFRAVVKESNVEAMANNLLIIRLFKGPVTTDTQTFKVPCSDRTRMLTQELLGFVRDIEDERHFQRTRETKKHW